MQGIGRTFLWKRDRGRGVQKRGKHKKPRGKNGLSAENNAI